MQAFSTIAASLAAVAALAGCTKSHSDRAQPVAFEPRAAPTREHAGIDWFNGSVAEAFAHAQAQNKLVLLYWGAEWCVPCHELKAKLFTQQAFVDKTRRFVAVYLDGDDPGAQKWGESFNVRGYPTMLILRPDRTQLASFAGAGVEQYATILDQALGQSAPIKEILAGLDAESRSLSTEDCKRLANAEYREADLAAYQPADSEAVRRVAQRCPLAAHSERVRLMAMSAVPPIRKEARAVLLDGKAPSPSMQRAMRDLVQILADPESVKAVREMAWFKEIEASGEQFFELVERSGAGKKAELYPRWVALLDAHADDPTLPVFERLDAFLGKLKRVHTGDSQAPIPEPLAVEARRRVRAALAGARSADERSVVVRTAVQVLYMLRSEQDEEYIAIILKSQIETAAAPYYYMSQMAILEEGRGNKQAATHWLERAYLEAKGPETRFANGVDYVHALLRYQLEGEAKIRDAAMTVLGELEGPDRIYNRTREQLERLDRILRQWNSSGAHERAITAIRDRMAGVCKQIPQSEESAREACDGFLSLRKAKA